MCLPFNDNDGEWFSIYKLLSGCVISVCHLDESSECAILMCDIFYLSVIVFVFLFMIESML